MQLWGIFWQKKICVIVINSKYLHDGKYFGYFCRYVRMSFNCPQGCRGEWLKTATTTKFILNKNNISEVQIAILTWYREIQCICNPYATLKCHNRKFYSLIYDDIQKFSRELNSSFVHSLSATNKIGIMLFDWDLWGFSKCTIIWFTSGVPLRIQRMLIFAIVIRCSRLQLWVGINWLFLVKECF